MAGLLNLVPRYLPRYGMAPEWTRAVRPLVLVFAAIAFLITWIFDANVDQQSGAYATGVLVLMTSASVAVTLSAVRRRSRCGRIVGFGIVAVVFVYTTIVNIIERPDGVRIASLFILAIIIVSLSSRVGPGVRAAHHQYHARRRRPRASSPTTSAGTCNWWRTTRSRTTPSAPRNASSGSRTTFPPRIR